ncbi:acyl carrier protein [Nocardia tenerifensis]|uniref:Acyl carrier protein n=1 Tax=Nocardia tenerifensis TaxID=228006 RepID=A0A318JM64_9NOCA|nr:acyl carrier protein [Nocardia tenerifensis]PXX54893.1 acyl carrier protein [Nocardia tenerifensis]
MIELEELVILIRKQLRGRQDEIPLTEDTVIADIGLSSLQFADIVFTLEEEYEVEFDPAKAASAKTVGDVIAVANSAIAASL